ncbi:phosphodiester glycosidase family protein [Catellatospora coxensis]
MNYAPRGGDGAAQVAIGGNLVLVKDGVATTVAHPKNPRTAVGFSADGLKMWLVVVDGRSTASVGMTYVELANYMKSLGADDAINLDGGGSSTLVARMPGATSVSVRNTPSDGAQRPVPNGIGFVSTAQAWTTTVDNTTAGRFTASANWGTSTYSSERFGADYRFADPVLASDSAWYKVNIPQTAAYEVSVWYPANAGYNDSTPYIVATTSGNQTVRVNQRVNGGRWVSLGVFNLAAGDANVVGVSRWTAGTGYVIADAVRITRA